MDGWKDRWTDGRMDGRKDRQTNPIIQDPSGRGQGSKNGLKAKNIKLPQMNFFLEKQLIKFSCTYETLSFCKVLKKFLELIQSYEDVPFTDPKQPICPA